MTQAEFAEAVRLCEDKLFRIAYLSLRSYADCQDAVQEALLKAWSARGQLKDARYFDTWLTRILLNVITDMARRSARRPTSPLTDDLPAEFQPPDPDLRNAIRALDAHLRAPLLLKCVSGYSVSETAHMLHITPTQVRWRLEQARRKLRTQLADKEALL